MTTTSLAGAPGVHWDLTPLAPDTATARSVITQTLERCAAFATKYRGTLASIDADTLAELLAELNDLDNTLSRVGSYGHLRESVDITDTENRDLAALIDRSYVEVGNHLRFFELEWLQMPEAAAQALIDAPQLAKDRHYLRSMRRFAPHMLSEPEERMLAERSPAASAAWNTLFQQINSTLEAPFDSGEGVEPHGIDQLLSLMRHPKREIRIGALDTLYGALEPHAPTLAHVYDTLVGDRLAMDGLRAYSSPMEQTHLGNEVTGTTVQAMLDAVARHYPIAQRWFSAKATLLDIDAMVLADQYAPLGEPRTIHFPEAIGLVTESFGTFSPRIAAIAQAFVDEHRVDAEPRSGKRGGAFCASVAQNAKPYVLLNFTDLMNDVVTIAHEFGHGMHFQLTHERQTQLSSNPGIMLCEIASTFAEQITYDHLVATEKDIDSRRHLAYERVEGAFATIFRQAVLCRFEQAAYALRAEGGTLTSERLGEMWIEMNSAYYGDSLTFPDGYRFGWAYIGHFIHTRFYTYAYAYSLLVSLALIKRYREIGEAFVEPYLTFLSSGSSDSPAALLGALGLDLDDPGMWDDALGEVDRMIDEAQSI